MHSKTVEHPQDSFENMMQICLLSVSVFNSLSYEVTLQRLANLKRESPRQVCAHHFVAKRPKAEQDSYLPLLRQSLL